MRVIAQQQFAVRLNDRRCWQSPFAPVLEFHQNNSGLALIG
jgi:hypothetical protein